MVELLDHYLIYLLKDFSASDVVKISGLIKKVTLKKNEIYIAEGTFQYKIFYIKKGLIRAYASDEEGEEKTIFFRSDREFGADPHCFLEKKPAKLSWAAIEDSEILEINFKNFEEISQDNIKLMKLRIVLYEKLLARMYSRLESFILFNPENRLVKLLESQPHLCDRVPDKYLASFLGITPVSLSRIKKRIEKNHSINIC